MPPTTHSFYSLCIRSWKYWHAGMNHGKKTVALVSYDMYLECAEGILHPLWKVEKPVSFHRFREKLGLQQLTYSPSDLKYPGDEKLRSNTVLSKKRRRTILSPNRSAVSSASSSSGVTAEYFAEESNRGRLCGFLGHLNDHVESVKPIPNKGKRDCHVCGEKAHQLCSICGVALHYSNPPKNASIKVPCFFLYHDTGFCGLARSDWKRLGSPVSDWQVKASKIASHETAMKSLKKSMDSCTNSASTVAGNEGGNNNNTEEWNDRCV